MQGCRVFFRQCCIASGVTPRTTKDPSLSDGRMLDKDKPFCQSFPLEMIRVHPCNGPLGMWC